MASNNGQIINGVTFNAETDYSYTKPKVNASGGKSIGILNKETMKGLYLSTPLMLTWGVNENTDEKTGTKSYDMSLQFPKEEYNTEIVENFLNSMKSFEQKLKSDAIQNSKDWFNKQKMSSEVVDALWTPMLKYPKDKETGEFDYNRPPTLRIKLNMWDGVFKCELYDIEQTTIFPNNNGLMPGDLIAKGTNVATVIQCGGLWFASGKFGVTWRLIQAVVKPRETLMGKCLITLSVDEKEKLKQQSDNEDDIVDVKTEKTTTVDDSDDDDDDKVEPQQTTPQQEVTKEIESTIESAPPKKKVVRKKQAAP